MQRYVIVCSMFMDVMTGGKPTTRFGRIKCAATVSPDGQLAFAPAFGVPAITAVAKVSFSSWLDASKEAFPHDALMQKPEAELQKIYTRALQDVAKTNGGQVYKFMHVRHGVIGGAAAYRVPTEDPLVQQLAAQRDDMNQDQHLDLFMLGFLYICEQLRGTAGKGWALQAAQAPRLQLAAALGVSHVAAIIKTGNQKVIDSYAALGFEAHEIDNVKSPNFDGLVGPRMVMVLPAAGIQAAVDRLSR